MTNDSDSPILIFPHRGKLCLVALGSAAFVAVGVWLALAAPPSLRWLRRWALQAFVVLDVFFFGFCMVYALFRLVGRSPLLVIDTDGIDERGSALRVGRLRWDEVAGVEIGTFLGQRFLTIQVHDPKSIIARQPWILRPLFRFNHRATRSPVAVPASVLPAPAEEIREQILAFRLRASAS